MSATATDRDGALLLEAVKADPNDDLVRLAYADWLDEVGRGDRADYVRTEVAGKTHPDGAQRDWPESIASLTGGFDGDNVPESRGWDWRWDRGFVRSVRSPLGEWLRHGPRIVRAHPVEHVGITSKCPGHEEDNLWHWHVGDHDGEDALPSPIFDLLTNHVNGCGFAAEKNYAAKDAADGALSAACILWAKRQPEPR